MSYTTEAAQLVTIVDSVRVGGVVPFQEVYDFEPANFWETGLPVAIVTEAPEGSYDEPRSNRADQTTHAWQVKVITAWEGNTTSQAAFRTLFEATLTALRQDATVSLGGTVHYAINGPQTFGYLSTEDGTGTARVGTITLKVVDIENRT